jgi:hypothetical protein
VPIEADPGPHGNIGTAECPVRDPKGDGGDVAAGEQVSGGRREQLGTVLVLGQALMEREQRGSVAPERVAGRAEPRRSAIAQREGLPGPADAELGAIEARPAPGTDDIAHPHLLAAVTGRLAETHPKGAILGGAAIAGDDELVEGIRSKRGRRRAS